MITLFGITFFPNAQPVTSKKNTQVDLALKIQKK